MSGKGFGPIRDQKTPRRGLGWSLLAAGLVGASPSACALEVMYFDRPPYYSTVDGQAAGFLIDLTRQIFLQAGVEVRFTAQPPNRILTLIADNTRAVCSPGWFKTHLREISGQFTAPIYRDYPVALAATIARSEGIAALGSFRAFVQDSPRTLVLTEGFSYGNDTDSLLEAMGDRLQRISSGPEAALRLVTAGRIDATLVNQEEYLTLAGNVGGRPILRLVSFPDLPGGELRYLYCSHITPSAEIDALNAAIKHLLPHVARTGS